jgi:replicative DNA helicase
MNADSLGKELDKLESEMKTQEEKDRLLWVKERYTGEDEVITATEYLKLVKKEHVSFKAYSNLKELDKIVQGFRPGTLITISGPTKQGKTTFCQTLTNNFSRQGFKCLWFSFDTPPIELIERFPAVPAFYLPKRNKAELMTDWIEEKIVEGIAKFGTKIVFIDHLGFLSKYTDRASNYATELTSIVRELKQIAIRWNVVILLNHHITKIGAEEVPNWSHLKDSSGIAQDSDMVIMIWRERSKPSFQGEIVYTDCSWISVQLHRRTGKTGNFKVQWKANLFQELTNPNAQPF